MLPRDVELVGVIPCTTVARTLLDLAAVQPRRYEADFLWRDEIDDVLGRAGRWLIAEVDGRGVHATRRAFEQDRRGDQRLMLAGYRVVRFPWRQVVGRPSEVRWTSARCSSRLPDQPPAAALSSSRRRSASSSGCEGAELSTNSVSAAENPIGSS